MNRYIVIVSTLLFLCWMSKANAHEMVPTYPVLEQSYQSGLLVTTLELFNKRKDVEYYEIAVFDNEFRPIPFVSSYSVFKLEYLGRVKFDVYIRAKDKERAVYVCSRSKLRDEDKTLSSITSMICSKFKRE